MADNAESGGPAKLNPGRVAAVAMVVGGGLLAAVAIVWAIAAFAQLSQMSELPGGGQALAIASVVLGLLAIWGLGLLLWGAAEILRKLHDVAEALRESGSLTGALGPRAQPGGTAGADGVQTQQFEELLHVVRELRDISLLSEPERTLRSQVESSELARRLESEVPVLLREHDWQEARRRVQRARQRFPALTTWVALEQQIEQARQALEAHDVEAATREVNDLGALGAWDRAFDVVRHVQQRHPGAAQVVELVRRVTTGRDKAAAEERARLMARAQEATTRRDWKEALRLVEIVVERFQNSPEAHDVRQQLPTLRMNAEIQMRQQMEAEIRELVKEHHYGEALRKARELIERYPNSPQAAALREQLPRLEEKAAANW